MAASALDSFTENSSTRCKMLALIHEMSLAEFHDKKFPVWFAGIPSEQLIFEFCCDDQDCETEQGACIVRVWRKLKEAA